MTSWIKYVPKNYSKKKKTGVIKLYTVYSTYTMPFTFVYRTAGFLRYPSCCERPKMIKDD